MGVAAIDEAAGQGGEAFAVDDAIGMTELPLLWSWAMGCGEGLLPWTTPWGGKGGRCRWTRPRDEGERLPLCTTPRVGRLAIAVDVGNGVHVGNGLWGGVAAGYRPW